MRKGLMAALLWVTMLAGCNSEPSYQGVSFVVYNYTPWDLAHVQVQDDDGQKASSGSVVPGGGEGAVACCYSLRGTEFVVHWRGADGREMQKNFGDEAKLDALFFQKETVVNFPPTQKPPGDGPVYLELHIYPDEHMEMALTRKLLGQVRIPIVETTRWLYKTHREAFDSYRSSGEVQRVLAKVARRAWVEYRIQDLEDMKQYMRLYFTVASNFDDAPAIAAILKRPDRKPGDFARAVAALAPDALAGIRATGTPPGEKNV